MDFDAKEIALDRAVLCELSRSYHAPPGKCRVDIQALLDKVTYNTALEDFMNARGDNDWQNTKAGRIEPVSMKALVPLHDEIRRTVYYIEHKVLVGPAFCSEISYNGAETTSRLDTEQDQTHTPEQSELHAVLRRLTVEDGRFMPRRYHEWLLKKIQRRSPFKTNINHYASLCNACQQVLAHSLAVYRSILQETIEADSVMSYTEPHVEVFSHHQSMTALSVSALAGWHLCVHLRTSYPDDRDSDTIEPKSSRNNQRSAWYYLRLEYDGLNFSMNVHVDCQKSNHQMAKPTHVRCGEPRREEASTLVHLTTNAPEIIQLSRDWLYRCVKEDRKTCGVAIDFLPSRLIEVTGTGVDMTLASVRLSHRREIPVDTRYMALSHFWGTGKMCCLTGDVLEHYKLDIPLSMLSKTFTQALQVTLWLGFRYIWIDSLCIQQDSMEDWELEAATMGAIYRNSACTIAATAACDGNGGLFFERSTLQLTECPLFMVGDIQTRTIISQDFPTPLLDRAWAVQERYLSPRLLSFGSDKISWTCRRREACEGPRAHSNRLPLGSFSTLLEHDNDGVQWAWENIVEEYSSCKLTYWKDRWPAFQGLATEVANVQNWTLLHGLRLHLLAKDLLWRTVLPESETIELGEPSWSWLNCKGRVSLYGHNSLGDMEDCDITVQRPTRTSGKTEATGNILRIKACMYKLHETQPKTNNHTCSNLSVSPSHTAFDFVRAVQGHWFPDTIIDYGDDLWAFQVVRRHFVYTEEVSSLQSYESEGLIVTPLPGDKGYWRRVGTYQSRECYQPRSESRYPLGDTYFQNSLPMEDGISIDLYCPRNGEKSSIFLV